MLNEKCYPLHYNKIPDPPLVATLYVDIYNRKLKNVETADFLHTYK